MTGPYVDPVAELGGLLLEVEKPARYVGGEFGILAQRDAEFRTLIAFPDLYEIGMGNQALRIIYNRLNSMPGISCDRAFAPAPDFEKLLREKNVPLYGLDTGISLACLDLLMFTIGYELGLNGVLTMLDVSQIPLHCAERGSSHPIVIAGGPAVSNPLPYSPFIDAFWMGEAEAGFFDLAAELALIATKFPAQIATEFPAHLNKRGESRAALLEKIASHPNVWVKGKENASSFCSAKRAIAAGFSSDPASVFPVPSMKTVQHHGTVEIMRGCPNGCRFCHAGFWYRPMRQKSFDQIFAHAQDMVIRGGWRQISLSSLSSGDYSGVGELVEALNQMFAGRHVSFQMPSLKVSGFSLDLLEKISATRKSGLTFAVETPQDAWQMAINKEVTRDSVITILEEAKKRGWRTAKFYFMVGLPITAQEKTEEEEIVSFIIDIARKTRMHFNINVGIFVPKPHTPFQWAAQLDNETAKEKLDFIRAQLKPLGHKVSVSDPVISRVEGLLSRGDERAGLLVEEAWCAGSRLDAWSEYINKDKWLEILEKNRDLIDGFLSGKNTQLPWQVIDSCVTPEHLHRELEKSSQALHTGLCKENCMMCGVCGNQIRVIQNQVDAGKTALVSTINTNTSKKKDDTSGITNSVVNRKNNTANSIALQNKKDPSICRILFSFSKRGSAVFHGHLSLIEIFSMAFTRAGLPVLYTQGYNPLAKIEFAAPLATGISALCEIAAADFAVEMQKNTFITSLNMSLPEGIRIENAGCFFIPSGKKKHSLSSLLWGFAYTGEENKIDYVMAADERKIRQTLLAHLATKLPAQNNTAGLFSLERNAVLARNFANNDACGWTSYFDHYRFLYPNQ